MLVFGLSLNSILGKELNICCNTIYHDCSYSYNKTKGSMEYFGLRHNSGQSNTYFDFKHVILILILGIILVKVILFIIPGILLVKVILILI